MLSMTWCTTRSLPLVDQKMRLYLGAARRGCRTLAVDGTLKAPTRHIIVGYLGSLSSHAQLLTSLVEDVLLLVLLSFLAGIGALCES